MKSALQLYTPAEKAAIEAAVAAAEKRTSAEFVCALATESGRYDRAESLMGLTLALLGLTLANYAAHGSTDPGSFEATAGPSLAWQFVTVVVGFVLGSALGTYCHPVRRLFVPVREMIEETRKAARAVFALRRLASTKEQGGVLVYYSIFERRILVLADEGAQKALGQEGLGELRALAMRTLHQQGKVAAFTTVLEAAAEKLEHALPVRPSDTDEISNELVIYHPRA